MCVYVCLYSIYLFYIPWPFPPVWGVADNTKETMGVSLRSSSNDEGSSRNWMALLEQHNPSSPVFHNLRRFIDAVSPTAPTTGLPLQGNPVATADANQNFVDVSHFQMETIQSVLLSVRQGDWMASIDLREAYLQVPVHPESRPFLHFVSKGRVFQFKALCFGLSTAPQVFSWVMAPVSTILHTMGIHMRRYLDDWLVQSSSRESLLWDLQTVLRLCHELGVVINLEKSHLVPSQVVQYLGVVINTQSFVASPSLDHISRLLSTAREFRSSASPPARLWLSLLGMLSSLAHLVPGGRLRMRSLQLCLNRSWDHEVQPVPQRQDDRPVLRQCHDSRLSQAIGRHKVLGPVLQSKGDPPVDRIYADHDPPPVHPGFSQHESRSPQSAQPRDRVRVDTTPGGGPGPSSPVAGYHRPVRDLADDKAPSVLCPSVGTQGNGSGCIPPTLGQPPGVCLPSNSHHKESSSQTESLSPLRSHPDRPLLASKGMVSRSSGTSIRHSNRTTQTSRSAATIAFPSVSRKSPNASADCVATLKRFARQAGFSEAVAGQLALCRRTSTRLNYQARWGKFRKWCKDFHHRSSEPTIPKVAEFLTFLFKTEKASVSTIKGYRSMLSSVFKFCLPEISTSPILKDLTRSFEISAPRPVHRSPSWDLDKVLEYLSGPPFEPLADASFRNKTRKALFLVAMATAKRVRELQALSFSVSRRGDDLVLHYDPFFLAKTESVSNPLPRSVIVQSLVDFVGDLPERVLCPVRAVRYLRRAARSVEFTPSRLFVSPSDPRRSMSKNAMSFFLRQLITESGAVSSSVPPRAHDIRGIATSLNYYSNLSLSAIKEAATWKSNRVFATRYLKDMSATRSGLKDRGPLIAAGSAVHQN